MAETTDPVVLPLVVTGLDQRRQEPSHGPTYQSVVVHLSVGDEYRHPDVLAVSASLRLKGAVYADLFRMGRKFWVTLVPADE